MMYVDTRLNSCLTWDNHWASWGLLVLVSSAPFCPLRFQPFLIPYHSSVQPCFTHLQTLVLSSSVTRQKSNYPPSHYHLPSITMPFIIHRNAETKRPPTWTREETPTNFRNNILLPPNEIPYGILCQWYPSRIVLPTASLTFLADHSPSPPSATKILEQHSPSITFVCAEQLYMFGKALNFSDGDTCSRILATPDPKDQKHLGQRVKHYNEFKWSRVKSRVVVVGNWYKFREKGRLRDSLLETGERELCEASPVDRVWGIGFGAEDAEDNREGS
jgi:ribA/ribD-fused uncharacterized protein